MNSEIPHPCSRCEHSRLSNFSGDENWILWCVDNREEYLGDADCPYIRGKFPFSEIPIPCNQCQHFHLEEYQTWTLVPACAANRVEYWGQSICPYAKETS